MGNNFLEASDFLLWLWGTLLIRMKIHLFDLPQEKTKETRQDIKKQNKNKYKHKLKYTNKQ